MQIEFNKSFNKGYAKLSPKQKQKIKQSLLLFRQNPHDDSLYNHALKGKLKDYRAIAADGDLRLIFLVEGNYDRVEFIMVGSHNQVYE